jgi:2,4'-dihydroxyacetophenone dioxygenase
MADTAAPAPAVPATQADTADATSIVRTSEIPWAELAPGIEMKVLRQGEGSGRYTVMNRFAPGTVLPKHYHHGEVHAFTVSGTWGYREYDWTATAGDYVFEEVGTVHTLEVPEDATEVAVIQFVIEKGMDFYDENDEVFHTEDPESIVALYLGALDQAGTPRPEGMLP